jgi:hypothetical protein
MQNTKQEDRRQAGSQFPALAHRRSEPKGRAGGGVLGPGSQITRGGRKNKTSNRRTWAPARKKKYVPTFLFFFFLVRFWAFLGKGSSKTREKKLSAFQKKSPGKHFFGGGNFFWVNFFNSFSSLFFCCVG